MVGGGVRYLGTYLGKGERERVLDSSFFPFSCSYKRDYDGLSGAGADLAVLSLGQDKVGVYWTCISSERD